MTKKVARLASLLWRLYKNVLDILTWPLAVRRFLSKDIGSHHDVGLGKKLLLVFRFMINVRKIESASHWREHLEIAREVLRIPAEIEGDVIECGCYRGGATANLSIVCSLTKRRLIVCDSFEGLPDPKKSDKVHHLPNGRKSMYKKGMFKGSLESVKDNIRNYGCIEVCDFVPGWFQDTLKTIDKRLVVAFLDVDLKESLETCVLALWNKMQPEGVLFCHEAPHMENVGIFWDEQFWKDYMNVTRPPGFIGGGTGLPLLVSDGVIGSALGYTVKQQD